MGPDRHINLYRVFTRRSARRNLGSRILAHFNSRSIAKLAMATLEEDRVTIAAHHRGLTMPVVPQGGLVSRREERVFHFQNYVAGLLKGVNGDNGRSEQSASGERPFDNGTSDERASQARCEAAAVGSAAL